MKIVSFITGLIGSLGGIIINVLMFLVGATSSMKSIDDISLIILGFLGVIFSLFALICSCIPKLKIFTGVVIVLGGTINILSFMCATMVCNDMIKIAFSLIIVLLLVAGILRLAENFLKNN